MHYSAKRGLAIACRLFVWKSWKLIPQTISATSSLFVAQRSSTYSQENIEKFSGENVLWIHITGFASWRRPSVQLRDIRSGSAARLWFVRGGSRDHAVAASGWQRSLHQLTLWATVVWSDYCVLLDIFEILILLHLSLVTTVVGIVS